MNLAETYYQTVRAQLDALIRTQTDVIDLASDLIGSCLLNQRWVYVFGTGHSHMLAEELFYRAGGLPCIRPVLCPDLMLHESAVASTEKERQLERVPSILREYPMTDGDVLIVASNSGRNAVPVELAMAASELGVDTVAIINRRHSESFSARHPSGKKLGDVADVVLDNCGVPGDACVPLRGSDCAIGAASTVTGAVLLQTIACAAVDKALEAGWQRRVFQSANAEREEDNRALIDELRAQGVRHL